MSFTKKELTGKSLDELKAIATDLGISVADMDETQLMYEIIDQSAIQSASQKNEKAARKRTRMKPVDHVYSATENNTKKVSTSKMVEVDNGNDLFSSLPKNSAETKDETADNEESAADNSAASKKRRGRPKKQNEEVEAAHEELAFVEEQNDANEADAIEINAPAEEDADIDAPKKKRGRPKKDEEKEAEEQATENTSNTEEQETEAMEAEPKFQEPETANNPMAEAPSYDEGSDFIIICDIPKEDDANTNPMNFFANSGRGTYQEDEEFDMNVNVAPKMNNMPIMPTSMEQPQQPMVKQEPAMSIPAPSNSYDFADVIQASGVLEIMDGYGFLRSSDYNYLSSPDDIYINPTQIKHYSLKTGDVVEGTIRPPKDNEKFFPMVKIDKINGCAPSVVRDRVPFEYLTPLFPEEKFNLCSGKGDSDSSRIVDLFAPIGKGQRALIVAQPKTGKTLLMKDIANSIARNHPEAYLMMLLIDERPEEVTDMARTVNAEVIASTFDAPADNHVKIANLVLEKAKRMVECGHDVVIFLDSITRLARAYNTVSPASGKVLTGGVDANALQKPKRFFGAARNIEGKGSLTIIATALIDTGSKMDEVIFEEFKGTGNMELQLDRSLANKRVFPAVNLVASSTRRDDLLQDEVTRRRMWILRKHISDMNVMEAMDVVLGHIQKTQNNEEFLLSMNG